MEGTATNTLVQSLRGLQSDMALQIRPLFMHHHGR